MTDFSYKGEWGKYKRKNGVISSGIFALIQVFLSQNFSTVCSQEGKRTMYGLNSHGM